MVGTSTHQEGVHEKSIDGSRESPEDNGPVQGCGEWAQESTEQACFLPSK